MLIKIALLSLLTLFKLLTITIVVGEDLQTLLNYGILEPISLTLIKKRFIANRAKRNSDIVIGPSSKGSIYADGDQILVQFRAFGQFFQCLAKRRASVISGKSLAVTVLDSQAQRNYWLREKDIDHFEGHLIDNPSPCYGYLGEEGRLSLTIEDEGQGHIFVEPSTYYFDADVAANDSSRWYNNLIYRGRDLHTCDRGWCFANESSKGDTLEIKNNQFDGERSNRKRRSSEDNYGEEYKRSLSEDDMMRRLKKLNGSHFTIRAFLHSSLFSLYKKNEALVVGELVAIYTQLDKLFRLLDFDNDGWGDNLGSRLVNITLMKTHQQGVLGRYYNNENPDRGNIRDSLLSFKKAKVENPDLFSPVSVEHFIHGTKMLYAGQAFVGAVCRPPSNALSVTFRRRGGITASRPSAVFLLIHETLHTMGARDIKSKKDTACKPKRKQDNLIDYGFSWRRKNPSGIQFTDCNRIKVLKTVTKVAPFKGCFTPDSSVQSECGNLIVEEDEECDSWPKEKRPKVGETFCCSPPYTGTNSESYVLDKPCTLARNAHQANCDPYSSPCCNESCEIVAENEKVQCSSPSNECIRPTFCDGLSAACPSPEWKPDGTPCNHHASVCSSGVCEVSICEKNGLVDCDCQNDSLNFPCSLCCLNNSTEKCLPSVFLGDSFRTRDGKPFHKEDGIFCGLGKTCQSGLCLPENDIEDSLPLSFVIEKVTNNFTNVFVESTSQYPTENYSIYSTSHASKLTEHTTDPNISLIHRSIKPEDTNNSTNVLDASTSQYPTENYSIYATISLASTRTEHTTEQKNSLIHRSTKPEGFGSDVTTPGSDTSSYECSSHTNDLWLISTMIFLSVIILILLVTGLYFIF